METSRPTFLFLSSDKTLFSHHLHTTLTLYWKSKNTIWSELNLALFSQALPTGQKHLDLHVTLLKSTPLDNINKKKVQLIEKKSISIISSGFSLWSDISNLPPISASGIEGRPSDPCTYAMWTAKKKTQLSGMLFTARRHITNSQVHKQSIQVRNKHQQR